MLFVNASTVSFGIFSALLPLAWVVLVWIGGMGVNPAHVGLLLILGHFFLNHEKYLHNAKSLFRAEPLVLWFFLLYAAYQIALLSTSVFTSDSLVRAVELVIRQAVYVVSGFCIATIIYSWGVERAQQAIRLAFTLSLFTLIGAFWWTFNRAGQDFLAYLVTSAASPSFGTRVQFMNAIFQGYPNAHDLGVQKTIVHNIANGIFFVFMLGLISVSKARGSLTDRFWGRTPVRLGLFVGVALLAILLVVIFARTTLLSMLIVVLVYALVPSSGTTLDRSIHTVMRMVVITFAFTVLALLWLNPDFMHIFFLSTASVDAREVQYLATWDSIGDKPLVGRGADAQVFGFSVHNLFLRAWYQGGPQTLILAVAFMLVLAALAVSSGIRGVAWRQQVLPSRIWVWTPCVIALPVVRSQRTASDFNSAEWACIGLFLAYGALGRSPVTMVLGPVGRAAGAR